MLKNVIDAIEGTIGKELIEEFQNTFKEELAKNAKENEVKKLNIKIKSAGEIQPGVGLNIFSISEGNYSQYADDSKDYIKNSDGLISISMDLKEESNLELIKATFEQFKPMILELPFVSQEKDKVQIELRNSGTKVFIDVVTNKTGDQLQSLKDFEQKSNLNVNISTGINIMEFFSKSFDDFSKEATKFKVEIGGSLENGNYISKSLLNTLEKLKEKVKDDKPKKKKVKYAIMCLICFLGFSNLDFNFDVDSKLGYDILKNKMAPEDLENVEAMKTSLGPEMIKPMIESFGLLEPVKVLNLDALTIFILSPQLKAGLGITINLPGLTQAANEKILV